MEEIEILEKETLNQLHSTSSVENLDALRVSIMGKQGTLTNMMKKLGALPVEERKEVGNSLNQFRDTFQKALLEKRQKLEDEELTAKLQADVVDITLPVQPKILGKIHPITRVIAEITEIFAAQGFEVREGPDIEDEFHNFTALNIAEDHPARQMHDTFYMPSESDHNRTLLRTHTSNVQVRTMQNEQPPIRIIAPGKTYRCDSDQTHTPMFHQVEGLYIDKKENVNMTHLKGCIVNFCRAFFGLEALPVRFRPSFFPFTEPSAEVDIGCSRSADGIQIGHGLDWMEILGCGMVHPNVLKNCGVDPNEYQGFAFGMGVERLAMLKYNIPDLRTFFEGSMAWMKHYGFLPFSVKARTETK